MKKYNVYDAFETVLAYSLAKTVKAYLAFWIFNPCFALICHLYVVYNIVKML